MTHPAAARSTEAPGVSAVPEPAAPQGGGRSVRRSLTAWLAASFSAVVPAEGTVAGLHRSRLLVAALVLGIAFAVDASDPVAGRQGALLSLGILVVAATFLYEGLGRTGMDSKSLVFMEMLFDIVASAWLVTLTGGVSGQFVLLFPLTGFVAGMLLGLRGGAVIGTLGALAFALIAVTSRSDFGQPGWAMFAVETSSRTLFYPLFFLAVGLLSGVLGTRMLESERALAQATHEVEKLRLDTESIVQNLSSGLLTIDRNELVVHFNHVAETLLGKPASLVRGKKLDEALDDSCRELIEKVETTLSQGIPLMRGEVRFHPAQGGEPIPIGISTSLLRDQEGEKTGVVALFTDLTEVRRLEKASRRQDRLSVIGGMAASIAHEVRNCVNPIAGSVEILRDELPLSGENAKLLELIGREAEQMERFVSELLNFTRGCPINLRETDVRQVVDNTLEKIRRHPTYRETVTLVAGYGTEPVVVKADPEQLEQVFFNLALNAVEAMGPVGKLTVSVEPAPSGDEECWVEFADTGAGMTRETLDRIFEPYYSTKGSGTGLGLAIAHRIVERHSGRMEVTSHPGTGTRVRVWLPGAGGGRAEAGQTAAAAA
jgi:PAS domain S-box-containing protein